MVVLIAAIAQNSVIGYKGVIPWKIPQELQLFKKTTVGHTVIMGRKTFEGLPNDYKPLPNRLNIVITNNMGRWSSCGNFMVASSLPLGIKIAQILKPLRYIFIIGGAQLYRAAFEIDCLDKLLISEINRRYDGDAYFPEVDWDQWYLIKKTTYQLFNLLEYIPRKVTGGYKLLSNSP